MKVTPTLISLAVFAAVSSYAHADPLYYSDAGTPFISSEDVTYEATSGQIYGISVSNGATVKLTGSKIVASSLFPGTGSWNAGVYAGGGDNFLGTQLTLGGASTESISVTSSGEDVIGIWAHKGATIDIKTQELKIDVEGTGYVYGILVQNATTNADADGKNRATLNIDAENTYITVGEDGGMGIVAMSEGVLNISGNLYVEASSAIVARGDAVVNINESGENTVVLKGDIVFDYDSTSGTSIDADVNINLSGADSYWEGNTVVSWTNNTKPDESKLEVSNLKLSLSDGATWTPTVINEGEESGGGFYGIALNSLTLNGGVINITNIGQVVQVESLSGSGGTVNVRTDIAEDGSVQTASLKVDSVNSGSETPSLTVTAAGITADDVTDVEAVLQALNSAVSSSTGELLAVEKTNTVAEGDVKGAITQTVDASGEVTSTTQQSNSKLSGYSAMLSLGTIQWRHEMNDLNKRMGELRDSAQGVGSWARLYGSEQEYGSTTAKNTTIQVGTDFDVGAGWKVGAAFSYTDGNSKADNAESDSDMYSFGIYGTWLAENGLFVDLIGKYTRMSTDFLAGNMKGNYDNNAWSASVEAGWHLALNNMVFVEPQVELTYGRVMGDDFIASNGVKIDQDDTDSLIGRIGLRGGLYFPEKKGTIYARISVLHDFEGEVESTASKAGQVERLYDDLGGTWYEFGVGANFNLTDRTYTYVDLEKTTSGEVKENWRWNVGIRHVW